MTSATRWLIPDGWMPPRGTAEIEGHEAVCLLNTSEARAEVTLSFYFEDADPAVVTGLACDAQRTRHFRLDKAEEIGGYVLAPERPYALVVDSSVPITVQHTRVDTRSTSLSLMTTLAVPSGETS